MNSLPTAVRAERLPQLIVACLAATWLVWGSTYLVIRYALAELPPYVMMSTRFLCAGGLLYAWQRLRGAAVPTGTEWRNAAVVGALMLGGGMGGVAYSELSVGSGLVVTFIAVIPMLLVIVNLLFRVVPSARELLAVTLGLVGVLMLTQGQGFRASPTGIASMSLACLCWTTGSLLSKHRFTLAPGAMGFASEMLCGGVALFALSLLRGEAWHLPQHAGIYLAWAYLVVLGSLVAFSAYMILLERAGPSLAATYTLVNPIVALGLGVTLGGERVSAWEWLAAGVILIAVVLLLTKRR